LEYREVVTSFLQQGPLILLLRRSNQVGTYQGKWAAVSGFLEENESPIERAKTEINEEVGLTSADIRLVRTGEPLRVYDPENDTVWIVNPFLFNACQSTIRVDRETSQHKWVDPDELANYETVPRLKQTFDRVRWDLSTVPTNLSKAIEIADEIAQDRTNGASYLGRKSIEAIQVAVHLSAAESKNDLFKDILTIATRMRTIQPSMASIRNTVGRLLHEIDPKRQSSKSITEFRKAVEQSARETLADSEKAAELVSRNLCNILIQKRCILTHSFSSTVKRALELCVNSNLQVYVTESRPTFEGRILAHELTEFGLPTKVLPDTITRAFPIEFDAVIVGADSVLADGSVVNKAGTKDIARTAQESMIPVFVAAERSKLNVMQFLGQPLQIDGTFDLTPSDCISSIITEQGEMKPSDAWHQTKSLVRELYT
jgi:translation initiation factor 2B subunit (eIF-2B alpha/beta/delta family)/ADP-ribose pyrophosphatase YjhB (NUDIX family)